MKLTSFIQSGKTQLGVVQGEKILNLTAVSAHTNGRDQTAFSDMASLLTAVPHLQDRAHQLISWAEEKGAEQYSNPITQTEFTVPLANPGKIICVGLNYADHCRETNTPLPDSPVLFNKFNSALLPHEGEITWAADVTQKVDYEAELAVIIGKKARFVKEADALDYVAAYTIVNDISARDVQFADGQWIRGKSFDTFCPMGPFVVTADDIPDPQNLAIQCRVNGRTLQDSNTAEMIFKIPFLIEFISSFCTLYPGDIISTGTPHGVGAFRDPKVFLQPGDVVEVEIEGIGVLRNSVSKT